MFALRWLALCRLLLSPTLLEISPDGDFLGTLSRAGQGPRELERPNTLYLNTRGQLGLVQAFPGKVVLLERVVELVPSQRR